MALQLLAMGVDELQAVGDNDALGCEQAVHLGVLGGVERHKIIGHDTTATINHTMLAQGVILEGVGQMDAVLIGKLTMLVTLIEVECIVFAVALLIGFLDATTTGRIVMSYGETYLASILKGKRTLYQSFAKGTTTYDHSAILVLYGSRDYLGCRSGELIGENHNLALAPTTIGLGTILLARCGTTMGIDDKVALLQELIGYLGCCLKITSAIVLKVEDEVSHAFLLERVHRLRNLLMTRHSETA